MIEISSKAQSYLKDLLAQQDDDDVGIRVFVSEPGTPSAEACIAYCRPGEEEEGDVPVEYDGFSSECIRGSTSSKPARTKGTRPQRPPDQSENLKMAASWKTWEMLSQ